MNNLNEIIKYARYAEAAYNPEFYSPNMSSHFIENKATDTQLHILCNAKAQYVIFRGTEKNFKDFKTDLKFKHEGGTHEGFKQAYDSIHDKLYALLEPLRLTIFIGHSLGGALAIVANSMHTSKYKACFTFGAPRVFNDEEAEVYNELNYGNTFRFENCSDPVPYMPPYILDYRHVGETYYISEKKIKRNPLSWVPFCNMITASIPGKLEAHSIQSYIKKLEFIKSLAR